ncbi:hypothetical protein Echvi_2776 [Echinicola vietnamensis DSM 17526]|uniref:Uncharacterized protein n=1 Tax=Echinicola vietnamensis (strain DSM 17526 / LMG 23754 / KMM 6221) TaxID=926556 RepID=L0G2G5_ECHVK|nr:hypothetical protein Echvi_2776 [Echinicola vietnamensis DSM 17526]
MIFIPPFYFYKLVNFIVYCLHEAVRKLFRELVVTMLLLYLSSPTL